MHNRRKSERKESREFSAEEEARRRSESFSFIITPFKLRINPRLAVLIFPFSVYKNQVESCTNYVVTISMPIRYLAIIRPLCCITLTFFKFSLTRIFLHYYMLAKLLV